MNRLLTTFLGACLVLAVAPFAASLLPTPFAASLALSAQRGDCHFCDPNTWNGVCRNSEEGWSSCTPISYGGCSLGAPWCESDSEELEELDLASMGHTVAVHGVRVAEGVVRIPNCDGRSVGVFYSDEALAMRRQQAFRISLE